MRYIFSQPSETRTHCGGVSAHLVVNPDIRECCNEIVLDKVLTHGRVDDTPIETRAKVVTAEGQATGRQRIESIADGLDEGVWCNH